MCCLPFLAVVCFALKIVCLILASHTTSQIDVDSKRKSCFSMFQYCAAQKNSFIFTGIPRKRKGPHFRLGIYRNCNLHINYAAQLYLHFCDPTIRSNGIECVKEGTYNHLLHLLFIHFGLFFPNVSIVQCMAR